MKITEVSRGIPHIEDLEISEFIKVLFDWHLHEITEKLDGAQILFGIDENGFYTSRESKGGARIYEESHYDIRFSTTYMRSVHKLLENVLPKLQEAGLRPGDQVEAEVLYGVLPNVVPYSEGINYLIFLRTTEGRVNIDHLQQELNDQSVLQSLMTPYTEDGKIIQMKEDKQIWKFSRSPILETDGSVRKACGPLLTELLEFMKISGNVHNLSNVLISAIPLNKIPDWCEPKNWKETKLQIKEEREIINKRFDEYKLQIKEILLNHYTRTQSSAFGPTLAEGGWIEGVVLKHRHTGKMVKLVDKETFGIMRECAWLERNKLTENAKSIQGEHSFMANIFVSMAYAVNHPELGTMQAKNYLRKIGTITEERLTNLAFGIKFEPIRDYWLTLLERQAIQLNIKLDNYEKETDKNPSYNIANYQEAINKRTIETYADTFQKIRYLLESISAARTSKDLMVILAGKKLDEI